MGIRVVGGGSSSGGGAGTVSSGAVGNNPVYTGTTTVGPATPVATKTANYTMTGIAGDNYLLVDATGGAFNVTLPAATGTGNRYSIKVITPVANAVTVVAAGADTIQGAATYVMSKTQWTVITFTDYASAKWGVGPGTATAFTDLSGIGTVSQGSSGANLSATGGTAQVVFQESVGGAFTVRNLKNSDILGAVDRTSTGYFEDFTGSINGPVSSSNPFWPYMYMNVASSGQITNAADSPQNHPGVITLTTNANATGQAIIHGGLNSFGAGVGPLTVEWLVKINNTGSGSGDQVFNCGFSDSTPASFAYAMFQYKSATSANWVITQADGGAATSATSAIAVATGWHKLKVVSNATGTSWQYFVDDVELAVSPLATNGPAGSGHSMYPICELTKVSNVATYTVDIDYVYVKQLGLTR